MSKTTTTDMRLVPIDRLVPYVNNARTHSADQIMKLRSSLREFGFINPVIIDRDYGVIAGHGRLMAAKEEGFTEVPCVLVDHLTEAQKKPVEVQGIVKLGEIYQNPSDALLDPQTKFWQDGQEIPVEAVPTELLTADKVAVLDADGTLHVLIAPKITGTQAMANNHRSFF